MTITSFLSTQKTHIIYGGIILVVASIAYHFFKKDPEVITKVLTKVVTQVQTVEKVVTKDKIVYVTRTITTHKKDGDVIVEVDHEKDDTEVHKNVASTTKTQSTVTEKTVESFMKSYSIEAMFPVNPLNSTSLPDPLATQVQFGVRLFGTPVWAEIGTNGHLNTVLVGLRVEF